MNKIKISIIFLVITSLFLSCALGDSTGTLVLRLPGGSDARAISNDFANTLKFQIDFNGPAQKDTEVRNAGETVSVSLAEGNWTITIAAKNAAGENIGESIINVTIISGRTTYLPIPLPIDISGNSITFFEITNVEDCDIKIAQEQDDEGIINIEVEIPRGTDFSNLNFSVIHTGASISLSGTSLVLNNNYQDFSVFAENKAEQKYRISVKEVDAYFIYNEEELMNVGKTESWTLYENYRLMKDLNLDGMVWTPIGSDATSAFTGTFDGNDKVISNLSISNASINNQGLFGYIGIGGRVINLGLEDVNINVTVKKVGGIAGYNARGIIQNCYVTGKITGLGEVGGIVGESTGTIERCYSAVIIEGGANLGGIAGVITTVQVGAETIRGRVENCYATERVSRITIATSDDRTFGGVVGNNSGIIWNCYATGNVSGSIHVGGIVGHNTGTIQNCMALNAAITHTTGTYIGRVIGNQEAGTFTYNYARNMTLPTGGNSHGTVLAANWNTTSWWTTQGTPATRWVSPPGPWSTAIWNFSNVGGSNLPTLNNMPGNLVQSPVVVTP